MCFGLVLKCIMIQFVTVFSLILLPLLLGSAGCHAQNCSRFVDPVIQCTCVGDLLVYKCSILGPGTTHWEGSAFHIDCGNSIILRHSQFSVGEGASGSCNSDGIVGYSVGVAGQCFTSQLNVTIESSLDGATVSCVHVSDGQRRDIGDNTIIIITDQNPLPPPDNIQVVNIQNYVATEQLAFNWSSSLPGSCPSAYYAITSIDCGNCLVSTTSNHTTCQNALLGHSCNFVVRSVACGVVGEPSNSVTVILKVPNAPIIHSIPLYDHETTYLKSIHTMFEESEAFEISEGVDGSAITYTIMYTNALSGDIYNLTTIPASNCVHRMCQHVFEVSFSKYTHYSNINITVFGTNVLGNGTMSNTTIGLFNQKLNVKFSLLTLNVMCIFLSPSRRQKECSIVYGPGNHHNDCTNSSGLTVRSEHRNNHSTSSPSVAIKLPEFPQHHSLQNQLCFIVTASDEVTTVQVAGTFNGGCDPQQLSDGTHTPVPSNNTGCGAPLHSISTMNGAVCYTGVDTGSAAFYSCSNCNSGAISWVRTCQLNGTWNGSVPHCDCVPQSSTQPIGLTVSLTVVALGLVITLIVLIFLVVMIIMLMRAKAKIQQKLQQATLYDEIGIPPSIIDSSKNIAYSSTIGQGI